MDPANAREAMREMAADVAEGADMLLVKPALPSLDILARARARFDVPIGAYQVSGEYAQIEAAAERGWLDGRRRSWRRSPRSSAPAPASSSRMPPRTSRPGSGRRTDDRAPTAADAGGDARRPAAGWPTCARAPRASSRAASTAPSGRSAPWAGAPLVLDAGAGPRVRDADGRWYLDYIGSWGPAILGHAHPAVVEAVREAALDGFALGATGPREVELGERIRAAMPSLERMRFTSSGTEAVMSAIRLARGATGRDLVVKFGGGYHGHSDGLLVEAGSGVATLAMPGCAGVTGADGRRDDRRPLQRPGRRRGGLRGPPGPDRRRSSWSRSRRTSASSRRRRASSRRSARSRPPTARCSSSTR